MPIDLSDHETVLLNLCQKIFARNAEVPLEKKLPQKQGKNYKDAPQDPGIRKREVMLDVTS